MNSCVKESKVKLLKKINCIPKTQNLIATANRTGQHTKMMPDISEIVKSPSKAPEAKSQKQ